MANSARGVERLVRAIGYSVKGLVAGWQHETAFRQEVLLTACLLPLAAWLGRDAHDYLLLIGSAVLLLITELFNSAVEALSDRIGTEHHELSGRAKDFGAAAVFVAFLLMVLVWGLIAWQRFAA